mmetsp:Transcript_37704/g.94627  ORF Transcript_37704/g.94627 Transcript_37704/m.94627 type:complete len:379 (-) Transcript_37704:210-1346(-)
MMQPSPEFPQASSQGIAFHALVPKGAQPGDTFSTTTPAGQLVQLIVPVGAKPGDAIPVNLATVTAMDVHAAAGAPHIGAPFAQGDVVVGVPIGRVDSFTLEEGGRANEPDETQASFGWAMYALGWCACCFLGPFGPICWFGAWIGHRARPKEDRPNYPRERAIARLSCCTGVSALVAHLVLAIALFYYMRGATKACHEMYQQQRCINRPLFTFADVGAGWEIECPADCGPSFCYDNYVWGGSDGVYAEDSMLCGAALQSGVVEEGKGDRAWIQITPGRSFYLGTKQNGVHSRSASNGLLSFRVLPLHTAGNETTVSETKSTSTAAPTSSTVEPSTTGSTEALTTIADSDGETTVLASTTEASATEASTETPETLHGSQ